MLFGLAYQGFVEGLHAHLAEQGFVKLGPAYGYVVRAIADEPRMTQRRLAVRLAITEQGAGQIVDEMVRRRFVSRRRDPDDARARLLELGTRGRELLRLARAYHAAYEKRLASALGAANVEAMRLVLEYVVASSADDTAQGRLRAT